MSRPKIPESVINELRREVGFGCPTIVNGEVCGNPYLEWHHFDPPWRDGQTHDAREMVALCVEHHKKADAGAYTIEQLRRFKHESKLLQREIMGRFDWMRQRILVVVGGNFFYETYVALEFNGQPLIWLERDDNSHLLLNFEMLTTSQDERASMRNNNWAVLGKPSSIVCPPSGRKIFIAYTNGDSIQVEFKEVGSLDVLVYMYPDANCRKWPLILPITVVEINFNVASTDISFTPTGGKLGSNIVKNGFMSNCGVGISF